MRTKRKLRTKSGAAYLALELVDPTGRIEARVWNDVELLDGRFTEGDAVRVLGRVEKFRDRLQLDVRSLEASDVDPTSLTPALRRDADELRGFLDFLVSELAHPGLAATVRAVLADRDLAAWPATPDDHHSYAGGLLEHTVGVATLAGRRRSSTRACVPTCCSLRRSLHDVGRTLELGPGPGFALTDEGRLLGHVHLGLRLIEERVGGPDRGPARGAPALRRVASRRARGANGRGVGALPREPARRRRSDAQGRLTPLLLALGASLAWGVADFVGPLLSRTLGLLRIMFWGAGRRARRDRDRRRDSRRRAGGLGRPVRGRGGDRRDARPVRVLPRHADRRDERRRADRRRVGGDPRRLRDRDRRRPVALAAGRDGLRARRRRARVGRASGRLAPRSPPESAWRSSPRSASGSTSRGCMRRARSTSGGRR